MATEIITTYVLYTCADQPQAFQDLQAVLDWAEANNLYYYVHPLTADPFPGDVAGQVDIWDLQRLHA